ncbi:MAG: F-box protein [Kistimonas sp.]|nr:F-box protein [Kistimonas sp.]
MRAEKCCQDTKRPSSPQTPDTANRTPSPAEAFNHGVARVTTRPDSPTGTHTPGSGQHLALGPPPADIALWPGHLVEMVLRPLQLSDLARCSRVCRRWHEEASRLALQAHCFLQNYPQPYRRQLTSSLDKVRINQYLRPWYKSSGLTNDEQQQREAAMALLPCRSLLFTMAQQRVCTERFARQTLTHRLSQAPYVDIDHLLCSPDSHYLATTTRAPFLDTRIEVTLWQCEPGSILRLQTFHHGLNFFHLAFSADSRHLWGLDPQGGLCQWQRDQEGTWHSLPEHSVYEGSVIAAVASPDNRTLVLLATCLARVTVLHEYAAGDWRSQWHWRYPGNAAVTLEGRINAPTLFVFGNLGQCLLMASQQQVWAVDRTGDSWQEQEVSQASVLPPSVQSSQPSVAMASHGRSFAVVFCQGQAPGLIPNCGRCLLKVWQRDGHNRRWELTTRSHFDALVCGSVSASPAMAFSPEGHQLVIVPRTATQQKLRILSADAQTVTVLSSFGVRPGGSRQIMKLAFNATGQYLAAGADLGVQIWRRDRVRNWVSVAWINNADCSPLSGPTFSPDGYLCAASIAYGLSVWGSAADGHYQEKVRIQRNMRVERLIFTGDGTQLVLAFEPIKRETRNSWLLSLPLVPDNDSQQQDKAQAAP